MFEPRNLNGERRWGQRLMAFGSKLIPGVGLLVLGFLLTRAAAKTFPVGWILFDVAVIELSLGYSPAKGATSTGRAFPERSTQCRSYPSRPKSSYCSRRNSRTEPINEGDKEHGLQR